MPLVVEAVVPHQLEVMLNLLAMGLVALEGMVYLQKLQVPQLLGLLVVEAAVIMLAALVATVVRVVLVPVLMLAMGVQALLIEEVVVADVIAQALEGRVVLAL
jgi:hypothetical protein|tara:strand:+ start:382 stop:690 length:309 start_codon:yes stop_codon:yes gene_type:complete